MGTDKAALAVGGEPLARRLGAILRGGLGGPLVEVGPGRSGLPAVPDDVPGAGPLVAVATAARVLGADGWAGPAVVLACDLPRFSPAALDLLARWPGTGAAVPLVEGRRQPLCARWSAADLAGATRLAGDGQRSLRGLPGAGPVDLVTEEAWEPLVGVGAFRDADTPGDLADLTDLTDPAVSLARAAGRGAR